MRKSHCKKLQKLGIILCIALIAACIAPAAAFAEQSAVTAERESIHFINPTAITVVGDFLYVADNVENNKTAILCFYADDTTAQAKYTFELPVESPVCGLASNGSDKLYAFGGTTITELQLNDGAEPTVTNTYTLPADTTDRIVDVAYGKIPNLETCTVYALTKNALYQYSPNSSKFIAFAGFNTLKNAKACLSFANEDTSPFYYLHEKESKITCDRIYLANIAHDNEFESRLALNGFVPTGMFALAENVAIYNDSIIHTLAESIANVTTVTALDLNDLYGQDCKICDVASYGERLFVLNSKNKVDAFDKTDNGYNATAPSYTIGSDVVDKEIPSAPYTSFTLVRPNGYPANIVYKTNDDKTSVAEIITDAKEYIILGYENDRNSHYYYVMVGNKFGWVKKSGGAFTTPTGDSKLTVVNNYLSNNHYGYETKFISLNAVYIYELPLSNSKYVTVNQDAENMKTVKVLQQFTEGDQVWYYVNYDENKTGFVRKQHVGPFHITTGDEVTEVRGIGNKKINSSLFSAVTLYATPALANDKTSVDEDGNNIKLYSGARVLLISVEGDAAFIMRVSNDGKPNFGWVDASRLINTNQMTTNSIVGLSLLAVAIIVGVTLLTVFFKRKKRIKANKD